MRPSETVICGLFGWPVGHSISPEIHNAAFAAAGLDWSYRSFPVRPGELPSAFRGFPVRGGRGLNITIPHKVAVIELLDRLEDYDLSVLAFLIDPQVPFTNNQGEQDIRMIKVKQKISGCFRTLAGAQVFARIRGYLSTCRKQGHNLWEACQRLVLGQPFMPQVPSGGP